MSELKRLVQQEQQRLALQASLDGKKTRAERNRLGQFATPTALATDILKYAKNILPDQADVRFLDPAIGTGSFYSAYLRVFAEKPAFSAAGFEIDDHYGKPARQLWAGYGLDIRAEDFTKATPPKEETEKATLVICNPPYIRHHHMLGDEKKRLHAYISMRHGIPLSGLCGLYCYFLCLSKDWMAQGGLAAWLMPSEFMDVNYGRAVKEFLLNNVTLLHLHRFSPDDVQFGDALVSSAIVWFKNEAPAPGHMVKFSFGGSLLKPVKEKRYSIEVLREVKKWTSLPKAGESNGNANDNHNDYDNDDNGNGSNGNGTSRLVIGDLFDVKRGIATGANEFFIMSMSDVQRRGIPLEFLVPILPSPRYLKTDLIECDGNGTPEVEKPGFLFTSEIPEERIEKEFPNVWRYLEEGRQRGISGRYICRNRRPWYWQERRETAPFLCTYMGRANGKEDSRPFRFILNRSKAIAANVYLMLYPKPWMKKALREHPELAEKVWHVLQSIPVESLLGEGRVYGGGLHKLEPKELLNAPADELTALFPGRTETRTMQMSLF
ncbi:MAG: SAM-dependent DNA methyltransferase [Nitrospirae bacterium]|nr:SAM-dependent DNA methyltransferase [Nitrospirota bacterium]